MQDHAFKLSRQIENLLIDRNLRGMQQIQPQLAPGYYLRAAHLLSNCQGNILIATGFPINQTFETDGPAGALALYSALETLGATPIIACEAPLASSLAATVRVHDLSCHEHRQPEAVLNQLRPSAILAIERPGITDDARYYNMRDEDITARTRNFDRYIRAANCPTIAIGDGGNEIGMGVVRTTVETMRIRASITACDELLIADVSNWGAYGLIAMLGILHCRDLLAAIAPLELLQYLSSHGAIDGVTGEKTLTEDGIPYTEGENLIYRLRQLSRFAL